MIPKEESLRTRTRFISDLGHFFETYDGSEIMGWIVGLLTFATEALPLPDIAEALRISKAAASIHIRTLRQIGLVEKVSFPGDRRDFYLLHRDFEQGMLAGTMKRVRDGVFIFQKTLSALEEQPADGGNAIPRERLSSLQRLFVKVGQAIEELCSEISAR